jgi:hypothetical protein
MSNVQIGSLYNRLIQWPWLINGRRLGWKNLRPFSKSELRAAGITLYGRRASTGWLYSAKAIDQTPGLLPEEFDGPEIRKELGMVDSWDAALRLIDRYPWHRLYPLVVHPEFRARIWAAVQNRFEGDQGFAETEIERWRDLCSTA